MPCCPRHVSQVVAGAVRETARTSGDEVLVIEVCSSVSICMLDVHNVSVCLFGWYVVSFSSACSCCCVLLVLMLAIEFQCSWCVDAQVCFFMASLWLGLGHTRCCVLRVWHSCACYGLWWCLIAYVRVCASDVFATQLTVSLVLSCCLAFWVCGVISQIRCLYGSIVVYDICIIHTYDVLFPHRRIPAIT